MDPTNVFLSGGAGGGGGGVVANLVRHNLDFGVLRPFEAADGNSYFTVRNGKDKDGKALFRSYVANSPAILRRDDWLMIDRDVSEAERARLQVWNYFYGRVPFNIPDGMSKIAIQHAVATGDMDAVISMDPIRRSERNRPVLDVAQIPLPVIHSDGSFSAREVAVARNSGLPLDTTAMRLAGRRIGEITELLTLGKLATYTYAGGSIYGFCNHPQRYTATFTHPTASGWTPATFITELLAQMQVLRLGFFYGPYVLLSGVGWLPYWEGDYTTAYSGGTFRSRVQAITNLSDVLVSDYLDPFEMLLIAVDPAFIQMMNGMNTTTVQWTEQGGFEQVYKILTIKVPRLRVDARNLIPVVHIQATGGTTTTTTTTTTT